MTNQTPTTPEPEQNPQAWPGYGQAPQYPSGPQPQQGWDPQQAWFQGQQPPYPQQAYGQQDPYAQQGYAQNPYAQAPYPQQPSPYGQQPYPYGQQPYSQQPYGQPSPYGQDPSAQAWGAQPAWPATPAPEGNQRLGVIALALVAVATVAVVAASYVMGVGVGELMLQFGLDAQDLDPNDPAVLALAERVSGWVTAGMIASVVGFGGWVLAILAFGRRQGRKAALWGIILGVAAPILATIALVAGLWPAVAVL